eukprot:scaffold491904_cov20-Prasinocladus_malaysianus.AAC.1
MRPDTQPDSGRLRYEYELRYGERVVLGNGSLAATSRETVRYELRHAGHFLRLVTPFVTHSLVPRSKNLLISPINEMQQN